MIGGDCMGMSMIPENIVAVASGMKVLGLSVIGNKGLNLISQAPKHNNVLSCVAKSLPVMSKILLDFLP